MSGQPAGGVTEQEDVDWEEMQTPDCEGFAGQSGDSGSGSGHSRELLTARMLVITGPEGWTLSAMREGVGGGELLAEVQSIRGSGQSCQWCYRKVAFLVTW